MDWNLKILGSSSALPTDTRMLSSQLLSTTSHHFLFDCGEGTQFQLRKFGAPISKIDTIFLSHLHGDHVFGLFGLLSTYHMYKRQKPLKIYGQKGIKELIGSVMKTANTRIDYPFEIIELISERIQLIFEDDEVEVFSIPLKHSVATTGFYVVAKSGPLNIKKEFVEEQNIPYSWFARIKNGEDYVNEEGQRFKNKDITLPKIHRKSFAYITDTACLPELSSHIPKVDLLYHEATFANEHQQDAREKLHSTTREAAKVALNARAKKLVIGHFSTRYKNVDSLLEEAREIFPETIAACDGMDIKF